MLRGPRVILRAVTRDDLPRLMEFYNDVEVELLSGGDPPIPQSLAQVESDFEAAFRYGRGEVRFAIEIDGKFVGHCGLFHVDSTAQTVELGIGIGDREYWGKGYGREAIHLMLDYAFRLRNWRRVWLTVNGNNERAIRAYRACGFIEEGRQRAHIWNGGQYVDFIYMGIMRDEWEAQ